MARATLTLLQCDAFTGAVTVQFHGVSAAQLSAIRHALQKDVPCLALAEVTLVKCDAVWGNEFIAQRIGTLPVSGAWALGEGDGDGAVFDVHVTAPPPSEAPCRYTTVTSKDFVLRRGADGAAPCASIVHSRTPAEAAVAPDGFQVVTLMPGQVFHAHARAQRATGRRDVRWKCAHVTQVSPHPECVLRVETTGAVSATRALHCALVATEQRLREAARSLDKETP